MWSDKTGLYVKRNIVFLRRKCKGNNFLEEDLDEVGVYEVLPRIVNLQEVDDGIYCVETCNERKDWLDGHVNDYDYKLVPYWETKENV
jgi:hypothetical protein